MKTVIMQCDKDKSHKFIFAEGINDGLNCPVCKCALRPVDKEKIDNDKQLRGGCLNKSIAVDLNIGTDNLVKKLKAISKHTIALSDELENIDRLSEEVSEC